MAATSIPGQSQGPPTTVDRLIQFDPEELERLHGLGLTDDQINDPNIHQGGRINQAALDAANNGTAPTSPSLVDPRPPGTGGQGMQLSQETSSQHVPGQSQGPIRGNAPFDPTEDPEQMFRSTRKGVRAAGDALDQGFRDRSDYQTGLEEHYRGRGDSVIDPWLDGEGGYTPEQSEAIIRQDELDELSLTDEEKALAHLSPEEREAIKGDPYKAAKLFRPEYLDALQSEGKANTRAAGQRMAGSYDEDLGKAQSSFDAAIDPERLRTDPAYAAEVEEARLSGVTGTEEAMYDPDLEVSEAYLRERGWSDQDIAKITSAVGNRALANYRNASSDVSRMAAKQGNVSPLAQAEARRRFEREGVNSATDAASYAEMLGLQEQKNAIQSIEDTRLGAAGQRAGVKLKGAGQLYGIGSDAASSIEDRRLAAEQGLTDREMLATQTMLDAETAATSDIGHTQVGIEQDARASDVDLGKYEMDTITGLYGDAEANETIRATEVAKNRQSTDQSIIDTDLQTEMAQTEAASNRNKHVADLNQDRITQGADYVVGQQQQASDNVNKAGDQRLQNFGITTEGELGSSAGAEGSQARKSGNSFGTAFKKSTGSGLGKFITGDFLTGGGGAEGSLITKPTLMLIGESGPERVQPVTVAGDPTVDDRSQPAMSLVDPMNPKRRRASKVSAGQMDLVDRQPVSAGALY